MFTNIIKIGVNLLCYSPILWFFLVYVIQALSFCFSSSRSLCLTPLHNSSRQSPQRHPLFPKFQTFFTNRHVQPFAVCITYPFSYVLEHTPHSCTAFSVSWVWGLFKCGQHAGIPAAWVALCHHRSLENPLIRCENLSCTSFCMHSVFDRYLFKNSSLMP